MSLLNRENKSFVSKEKSKLPKDGKFDFLALLNDPIGTIRTAKAFFVALVDRGPDLNPEPAKFGVGEHVTDHGRATGLLRFEPTSAYYHSKD